MDNTRYEEFEGWIITIVDPFWQQSSYREQWARITVVFNRARGLARQLRSTQSSPDWGETPFISAQEMLTQLGSRHQAG